MKIYDLEYKVGDFSISIPKLELQEQQVHGIVGANGCGKTTLAKLIMGILNEGSGTIDYGTLKRKELTLITQKPYLMHTTVLENIYYPLRIRHRKLQKDKIDFYLKQFGLLEKKKQYARSLSGGERQKLALLRAIIFEPKCIIMDETCSNLDMESVELVEELIRQHQKENPITWIIITHQLAQVYRICQQVHVMERGHILQSGTVEEVMVRTKHPRVKRFISSQLLNNEENTKDYRGGKKR